MHSVLHCFDTIVWTTFTAKTDTLLKVIKAKNRLTRAGQTEEASALAQRIGRDIASIETSFD